MTDIHDFINPERIASLIRSVGLDRNSIWVDGEFEKGPTSRVNCAYMQGAFIMPSITRHGDPLDWIIIMPNNAPEESTTEEFWRKVYELVDEVEVTNIYGAKPDWTTEDLLDAVGRDDRMASGPPEDPQTPQVSE